MKKAWWGLVGLLVVALIGVAIFLATFDANRYRPLVVEKLQAAIGRPVRLEHLRLAWHGGVAVELQRLAVGEPDAATLEPLFEADTVSAVVKLLPLLKKQVEIDSLQIRHGSVRWNGRRVDQLSADAVVRPDRLEVRRVQAAFAGGTIHGAGTVEQLTTIPQLTLKVSADSLKLDVLAPPRVPGEPSLEGLLSATYQVTAQGREMATWEQSASGSGRLSITQWKVANLNVLREVFQRLSMLPGLVERLQSQLPASYAEKLNARDTVFEPLEVPMTFERGTVHLGALRLASDSFEMEGAGDVGLNGTVAVQSRLRIDPDLSAALMRSVEELGALADAKGRLELPLMIQGTLPQISVVPDLQYVASRVLVTKAQEWLGNALQRALEKSQGEQAP